MKWKVLAAAGVVVFFALSACRPLLTSQTDDPTGAATGPTGNVKISIPMISPLLAQALNVRQVVPPSAARTLIVVSKVDLELLHSGTPIASRTEPLDYTIAEGGSTPVVSWGIPVGTDYMIRAKIYNAAVSPTTPVLYGESEAFEINHGGTTQVSIFSTPTGPAITPVAVPVAPDSTSTTLTASSMPSEGEYVFMEEKWFTIDANGIDPETGGAVRILATGDAHSGTVILCADESGRTMGMGFSAYLREDGPSEWLWGGTASLGVLGGGMRYVGLITLTNPLDPADTSDVSLQYESMQDDPYEENDSIAEAYAISSGDVINGVNLDPLMWTGSGPPEGGDWYTFTLAPDVEDNDISLSLTTDADRGALRMVLYASDGSTVAEVLTDLTSGSDDLETVELNRTLEDGTYCVLIATSGPPTLGTDYTLTYATGTGIAEIGLY